MRVLTLNCWNVSEPFEARMELIRAGIESLQPDVIGFQEIVVRRDGFDSAACILEELGYSWIFGAAVRWNEGDGLLSFDAGDSDAFGNAIASRWPIGESEIRALPGEESGERRSALAARIETPAGLLPFVTTHLNWKLDHGCVRERQVRALAELVDEWAREGSLPTVLVGDFNAEPDSTEVRFLCGLTSLQGRSTYLQDAWRVAGDGGPGVTWDNRNSYAAYAFEPNRRLDYVFVSLPDSNGCGWIESARLAFTQARNGVFPSDHFGVVADIRI